MMGGVNNTDLRKRGFFAYVISTRGFTEGARAIRRSDRRSFGPHGWTEAALADHRAISPGTASLESHVDDWTHVPAVALPGRFVAVYRASR